MKIYDGRTSFYQWDVNQKLVSPDLNIGDEVHFSHKGAKVSLPVKADALDDGTVVVNVPNALLMVALPICAYRYIKDGNSEYTKESYVFEVKSKPRPNDYIYEESEVHDIESIVKKLLEEIGTQQTSKATIGEVTLLASKWEGENNLYSQVVEIAGVTKYSQVDLTPDIQQLAIFYNKDITFVTENEDGVVTVYVIGQKPENDYTIQVTITEVNV